MQRKEAEPTGEFLSHHHRTRTRTRTVTRLPYSLSRPFVVQGDSFNHTAVLVKQLCGGLVDSCCPRTAILQRRRLFGDTEMDAHCRQTFAKVLQVGTRRGPPCVRRSGASSFRCTSPPLRNTVMKKTTGFWTFCLFVFEFEFPTITAFLVMRYVWGLFDLSDTNVCGLPSKNYDPRYMAVEERYKAFLARTRSNPISPWSLR